MPYDIKLFQKRYGLTNKEMADICGCSLPTIQKWRSGEVAVSGAAAQLMRMLDFSSEGNPQKLREILGRLNQQLEPSSLAQVEELEDLEHSMNKVMDRLELMLESRRKDRELADSEARYRSMVESSRDPVCRWRPDTTLTYVNAAYAKLFSQSGNDLVGRKWIELVPENRRKALEVLVSDMVRRGEEETLIHEALNKDGTLQMQEWRDIPVKNEKGELMEFHSIGRDVTETFRLHGRISELELTKEALMRYSANPVFVFDQSGKILEASAAFVRDTAEGRPWGNLSDMMSGPVTGKFKRLLRRLSSHDEVCYRILLGDRPVMFKVSLIEKENETAKYLAVVEDLQPDENPVLSVRLKHEVVMDGTRHELFIEEKVANRVRKVMNLLARTVQVDRIYVFTLDDEEGVFENILEWCAEGITPHIEDLKSIPNAEYPWWINRIQKGQWIQIQDTSKMPRSATRERDILMAQGINSILVAPLMINSRAIGFVGFDHNRSPRVWHEQERQALEGFKREMEKVLGQSLGGSKPNP